MPKLFSYSRNRENTESKCSDDYIDMKRYYPPSTHHNVQQPRNKDCEDIESNSSDDYLEMKRYYPPFSHDNVQQPCNKNSERSKEKWIDDYIEMDELIERNLYAVEQKHAYLSVLLSVVQTVVLAVMMIQCSIATFALNPMIGPPPDALDYWGGKNALKILRDGEDWRLITPIFLHAGVLHLIGNISAQLDVGGLFEKEWGSKIWLFIYLTSALGSSIFSVCMKPDNVSVGSSGAVMGLFGGKASLEIILLSPS